MSYVELLADDCFIYIIYSIILKIESFKKMKWKFKNISFCIKIIFSLCIQINASYILFINVAS